MTFEELIAPMGADEFLADYWGKRPVHIKRGDAAPPAIGWDRLNRLFAIRPHWTENNVKLILNSRPVDPAFYMEGSGQRLANMGQVANFTAMGASLVVDAVQDVDDDVRLLTNMLARQFGGLSGANFYASFEGVQAFASHFDTHEVFALQCEGQKRWRIYANRADNPVETLTGDDAQQIIDNSKGPLLMEVALDPGDLLYIPRGFFHDALATEGASLHLTLGCAPPTGMAVLDKLAQLAVEQSEFRAYLPFAATDGSELELQLERLADHIAKLIRSPRFRDLIHAEQRRFASTPQRARLPERPELHFYARTNHPAELAAPPTGIVIRSREGEVAVGLLADVAAYLLERPAFSIEELAAKFSHFAQEEIAALVSKLEQQGIVIPYRPQL